MTPEVCLYQMSCDVIDSVSLRTHERVIHVLLHTQPLLSS